MENLGEMLRTLHENIKTLAKDPRTFSQDVQKTYNCKEETCCKDLGFLLRYEHRGDPDNGVPATGEIIQEMEYMRTVDPKKTKYWSCFQVECECEAKRRKMAKLESIMAESRLSKRFRKRTFDNVEILDPADFPVRAEGFPNLRKDVALLADSQRAVLADIRKYCEHYARLRIDGKGFGLYGPGGVGKTHFLAAKTLYLIERGVQSVFVNTSEIFQEIRNCFEADDNGKTVRQVKASDIIDIMKTADDLSLDDLGKERPTEWVLEILYTIINYRYENELPTSFSTNLSDEELKAHVGPYIHRRLVEPCMGWIMLIKGTSFERIRNMRGAG